LFPAENIGHRREKIDAIIFTKHINKLLLRQKAEINPRLPEAKTLALAMF
jgi:hypothetical protein